MIRSPFCWSVPLAIHAGYETAQAALRRVEQRQIRRVEGKRWSRSGNLFDSLDAVVAPVRLEGAFERLGAVVAAEHPWRIGMGVVEVRDRRRERANDVAWHVAEQSTRERRPDGVGAQRFNQRVVALRGRVAREIVKTAALARPVPRA